MATDFRLWVRDTIDTLDAALAAYQQALAEKALEHAETVMPGFTHLQTAQPVTFGHHLLAYVEMAARDRGRFADARKRLERIPARLRRARRHLVSDLDRDMTAKALGFDRPTANSLDAVSDRDFVMETLAAASITAVHLSRFAEEIVIWTSPLFGLVQALRQVHHRLVDHAAEAQPGRGRAGARQDRPHHRRAQRLLIVMKGLPLAYAKDMQEDKEGAMDALAALSLVAGGDDRHGRATSMPDARRMKKAAGEGYATATDLADWLVRTLEHPVPRGAPHHRPHRRPGGRGRACRCIALPLAAMQAIEPKITDDVFSVLSVDNR